MSESEKMKLKNTPLHALHVELGARMVPFAGYEMPVQYPSGILKEHNQTRSSAGLFDVSHMGQARLVGPSAASAFEQLVPGNIVGLEEGQIRYTFLTNNVGGIIDDLTVGRSNNEISLVVNASRKELDYQHIINCLDSLHTLEVMEDQALLALQGPEALKVLSRHVLSTIDLQFMYFATMMVGGYSCTVARSGYTGEDGFEISVASSDAEALARLLLSEPEVLPVGLGARDSLRLEAGLCLYGHDLDETTTPIEASLLWTIPKHRREDTNYPGSDIINNQINNGIQKKRVGILPKGRVPAREGSKLLDKKGADVGILTSGGFGPSFGGPVAMGYIKFDESKVGNQIGIVVRGVTYEAEVVALPFVKHRYHKAVN